MEIRRNTDQVSQLGRIGKFVRSKLTTVSQAAPGDDPGHGYDPSDESDGESSGSTESPGNLFECSPCDVVYIASEKRLCSTCGNEVEPVRSALADT